MEAPWLTLLEAGRLVGGAGESWNKVVAATFGTEDLEDWEKIMVRVVGISEIEREEVRKILRVREDCDR